MSSRTTDATDQARTWASRRWHARALKVLLFLLPILISIIAVWTLTRFIGRPADPIGNVAWWVGITVVATVVMLLSDRIFRRALPVAAMFELSLVFPDQAPSRFKVALRSGTVKQFKRKLEAGENPTTQEAAEALLALSGKLGHHDRLTRGHSERVRAYANLIAEEMGLAEQDREKLHWAALLHDIGKLEVPAEILNKDGRPDADEWEIIKGHPGAAAFYLAPLQDWLGEWTGAATQHHERWDGGGYPQGLAGEQISLAGRIVAVADAYDTITSVRSYKTGSSATDGRAELARCAGSQFDPAVVKAFLGVSVGKLRLVMGPFAWLAQAPILAAVPAAGSAAATTVTAAALTTTMAVTGVVVEPQPTPEIAVVAVGQVMDEDELRLAFADPVELTAADGPVEVVALNTEQPSSAESMPTPAPEVPRDEQVGRPFSPIEELAFAAADPTPSGTSVPLPQGTVTATPTPLAAAPGVTPTPLPAGAPTPTPTPTPPPGSTPTPTPLPTATPMPTPTPPPGSTATPTPPPTPTSTPNPTPTPLSGGRTLYFTNPGSGDTASSATLPLLFSPSLVSSLPNYDTDRDGDEGLTIKRGSGVGESDPERRQYWTANLGTYDVTGSAQLRMQVAVKDFDKTNDGEFAVDVSACTSDLSTCTSLGSMTTDFNQPGSGSFSNVVENFSLTGGTTAARPILRITVATLNSSDDDLWFAYDTTWFDSQIVFN